MRRGEEARSEEARSEEADSAVVVGPSWRWTAHFLLYSIYRACNVEHDPYCRMAGSGEAISARNAN